MLVTEQAPMLVSASASSNGRPTVSVVIVTWNARAVLLDCLARLETSPPSVPWEVIVVDNASSDDTCERLARDAPWVRLIANSQNRGLPAANNQGIAASAAPYVLIANPDVQIEPGAVDALIDLLARKPRAAFAIPRIRHPDGSLHVSAGDLPTLGEALLGRQAQRRRRQVDTGFWWDGWAHDDERLIGRGHEACYLVRRAAIAEIGLQDEAFFLDWEGIDWTARARELGWEVWFTPAAQVVHLGGASIRQAPLQWIVRSHRGMYRYFAKRTSPPNRPLLAAAFGARAVAKVVAAAIGVATYERGQHARSA